MDTNMITFEVRSPEGRLVRRHRGDAIEFPEGANVSVIKYGPHIVAVIPSSLIIEAYA